MEKVKGSEYFPKALYMRVFVAVVHMCVLLHYPPFSSGMSYQCVCVCACMCVCVRPVSMCALAKHWTSLIIAMCNPRSVHSYHTEVSPCDNSLLRKSLTTTNRHQE